MGFAKAQPPSLLSILGRPAKELGKERCESFHRAAHALPRKQRPQHRVPFHTGVERLRQLPAHVPATDRPVEIDRIHKRLIYADSEQCYRLDTLFGEY